MISTRRTPYHNSTYHVLGPVSTQGLQRLDVAGLGRREELEVLDRLDDVRRGLDGVDFVAHKVAQTHDKSDVELVEKDTAKVPGMLGHLVVRDADELLRDRLEDHLEDTEHPVRVAVVVVVDQVGREGDRAREVFSEAHALLDGAALKYFLP